MLITTRTLLWALLAFGSGLFASGLVLEWGFGVLPCPMCWWQRYAHLTIAAAALFGLLANRPRPAAALAGAASLAGLGVALWQVAAQQNWLPYPASCTAAGQQELTQGADLLAAMAATRVIPCDLETFTLLGASLAAWNIPAMLVGLGLGARLWVYSRQ